MQPCRPARLFPARPLGLPSVGVQRERGTGATCMSQRHVGSDFQRRRITGSPETDREDPATTGAPRTSMSTWTTFRTPRSTTVSDRSPSLRRRPCNRTTPAVPSAPNHRTRCTGSPRATWPEMTMSSPSGSATPLPALAGACGRPPATRCCTSARTGCAAPSGSSRPPRSTWADCRWSPLRRVPEHARDDAARPQCGRMRFGPSGFGLVGLSGRVAEPGGDVASGPMSEGGWELAASIPVK
jgi:hypothetical protein